MTTTTRPLSPSADRAARLFALHGPAVLRFARRRCPDLADDVLSETFAVAVRRADEIPAGHELPWLYVVAEHVLRNQLRSQQRARQFQQDLHLLTPGSAPAPELPGVGPELDELPERERLLLVMTALEGLSAAEAADRMGIPYGSARNALVSARRNLAVRLAAAGVVVAAAVALIALIVALPHRHREPRTVANALDRTIAQATSVHEVAVVSRTGEPSGSRYERSTQLDTGASTVALPSGRSLTAAPDEALRTAARRSRMHLGAREAADLDALQLASPESLRAMLADPAVRASVADGPEIDGHGTTTFESRQDGPAGRPLAVQVLVADDDSTVLEVRARRLSPSGAPVGARTTVRFVEWEPEPKPGAKGDATPPTTALGAPAPGAAAEVITSAPAPSDSTGAPKPEGRTSSGRTAIVDRAADDAPPAANTAAATDRGPANASAEILHARTIVRVGEAKLAATQSVNVNNEIESWIELSGQQRWRLRLGWESWPMHESWFTGNQLGYWALRPDGSAPPHVRTATRSRGVIGRQGGWLAALLPAIDAHAQDPGLAAGETLDGKPALTFDTQAPGNGTPFRIALDPSTRAPLEVVASPGSSMPTWTTIRAYQRVPAGQHARLLAMHGPRKR